MVNGNFARDRLSWLLRLPVVLIFLDTECQVLRWQLCSISEAALMLQSDAP